MKEEEQGGPHDGFPQSEGAGGGNREMQTRKPEKTGLLALFGVLAMGVVLETGRTAANRLAGTFARKAVAVPQKTAAGTPAETPAERPRPEELDREADRNLRETEVHEQWGTLLVASALVVAVASGVGFIVAYWNFSSNLVLGGTLALFLGALGVALVLHAHWLMLEKEATEPREQLESPPAESRAAARDFETGAHEIRRRGLLKTIGAAAGAIVAGMVVSLFRSLGSPPEPSLFSTIWKRGQRLTTSDGKPVSVNALEPGATLVVFPEDQIDAERAQTVLIRVNEGRLRLPGSRSNWAPMGYVAYSRVCTHAGCPVGLYETTTELLVCPCHQSTFDILRGALPTSGPAARALPQLPLYADEEGMLRAGGGFSEPPGPGFWGLT